MKGNIKQIKQCNLSLTEQRTPAFDPSMRVVLRAAGPPVRHHACIAPLTSCLRVGDT